MYTSCCGDIITVTSYLHQLSLRLGATGQGEGGEEAMRWVQRWSLAALAHKLMSCCPLVKQSGGPVWSS